MTPDLFKPLAQAIKVRVKAKADKLAREARVANLRAQAEAERAGAAHAREARDVAEAAALLLGKDVVDGPDPGAKAERRAAVADRAAEIEEARAPTLAAALREAEETGKAEAVRLYVPMKEAARSEVLAAVERLAEPLAKLLAAEEVRAALAPVPYAIPPGITPGELWSASHAVNALLAALPNRLRPSGLSERIHAEAARLATEVLDSIGGEHG